MNRIGLFVVLFVVGCGSEVTPVDPECTVAGRCPNACAGGDGVPREICSSDADCRCGLMCFESACEPYSGELKWCTCKGDPPSDAGTVILGSGTHTTERLAIDVIATAADGLSTPRDLAFEPEAGGQLWVVNLEGPAMVIIQNTGTAEQFSSRHVGSEHFFAKPSALAFGATGTLATAHEEDQKTQEETGPLFMGPTLWTSKLNEFNAQHGAHYDMLHNSPLAAGIAYGGAGNLYWVVDGYHSAITRYEFNADHGLGGADHSDGDVARFVSGHIDTVAGIPAHAQLDGNRLYVADTGNKRVVVLDTESGTRGGITAPNFDGTEQYLVEGAKLTTLADEVAGLEAPSGIAIVDDLVLVTDNATSRIHAFGKDGRPVDWVDLSDEIPIGGLMGIAVDGDGLLYVVDAVGNRVLRISAKTASEIAAGANR